jgi:pimeloyl-ACP methyl ester carboxylesterase
MEQQIHSCTTDDGVRIAYATVGEGPPLVKAANWLNLEFDWCSPVWRHLLAEFARDHTFICYDERGNGLSDWNHGGILGRLRWEIHFEPLRANARYFDLLRRMGLKP